MKSHALLIEMIKLFLNDNNNIEFDSRVGSISLNKSFNSHNILITRSAYYREKMYLNFLRCIKFINDLRNVSFRKISIFEYVLNQRMRACVIF